MRLTITTPAAHVLHLIAGGVSTEPALRAALAADKDGARYLAACPRTPGVELDLLERLGLIRWAGDVVSFVKLPAGSSIAVLDAIGGAA